MTDKKTIFISAYRNVSVRYILYSKIFPTLRKQGYRIIIFLKDNDLGHYREQLGEENVIFEPVLFDQAYTQLRTGRLQSLLLLVRRCMSGSSKDFENTTDHAYFYLQEQELSTSFKGAIRFQLIKFIAEAGRRIPLLRKAVLTLESFFFPGEMYDNFFHKYHPQMLITSSIGYMIDPYFMRAAKRHDCKVISIIHSWDNTSTKDYRGADPDHVIVWNEIMKREVNVFHDIPEKRISLGGIAHWDFYFDGSYKPTSKQEFLQLHGFPKDRKILFYGTSAFVNFPRTFDAVEKLLNQIQSNCFEEPVQLLVRLHPAYLHKKKHKKFQVVEEYRSRMESLKKKYGDLVTFNLPMMKLLNDDIVMPVEDMHHLADILHHSDILLTEYSTLMIEGSIFDLPIINIAMFNYRNTDKPAAYFETYSHIKRVLKTGACKNAYSINQLLEYINRFLKNPTLEKDQRQDLVDQEITTNKGVAGEAVGNYIAGLLQNDPI